MSHALLESPTHATSDPLARALRSREMAFALMALAVAAQAIGHVNGDISWLLTVCARMLAGERAYVDILEVNPPASILLYMPASLLAEWTAGSAEFWVAALMFAGAAASISFSGRIFAHAGLARDDEAGLLRNAAIVCFVLAPGLSFAQREHWAMVLLLPWLSLCVARAQRAPVRRSDALIASVMAGAAVCIKPHFGLAPALALLGCAALARSWRLLIAPEWLAAGIFPLAYAGVIFMYFPHYADQLAPLLDVYVPFRMPWPALLATPWAMGPAILVTMTIGAGRRDIFTARILSPLLAAVGFFVAMAVQRKGWVNHGLPGLCLALLGGFLLVVPSLARLAQGRPAPDWARLRLFTVYFLGPMAIWSICILGLPAQLSGWEERPGAMAAVMRHAPPRPSLIAISEELDVGHPLVRRLGGVWAGDAASLWLMGYSKTLLDLGADSPAYRARLEVYIARDAARIADAMRRKAPDVVLVEQAASRDFLMRHPAIAAAMAAYEWRETAGQIEVWTRSAPR